MNKPKYFCCICGAAITHGIGNNHAPVATGGKCCDTCNANIVIPERLKAATRTSAATEATRKEEKR